MLPVGGPASPASAPSDVVAEYKDKRSARNFQTQDADPSTGSGGEALKARPISSSSSDYDDDMGDSSEVLHAQIFTAHQLVEAKSRLCTNDAAPAGEDSDDDSKNLAWSSLNQAQWDAEKNARQGYLERQQMPLVPNRTTAEVLVSASPDDTSAKRTTTQTGKSPFPTVVPSVSSRKGSAFSPLLVPSRKPGSIGAPSELGSALECPGPDKYVRLSLPYEGLALRFSQNEDTVNAVQLIVQGYLTREKFIQKYHYYDSPAVLPPTVEKEDAWASREPRFDPFHVKVLPNLRGYTKTEDGVVTVYTDLDLEAPDDDEDMSGLPRLTDKMGGPVPTVHEYLAALKDMMRIVQNPACKSLCYQRLKYLEERFSFHLLFNGAAEQEEVRNNVHRDFYNVRKVDTHVHHSACMTQKHLLRFIRNKYRTDGDALVAEDPETKQPLTLHKIFVKDLGLTAWEASVDNLDVHALNSCFHRFDRFNTKYNPFGTALLREVFLKTDNKIKGRELAELTKEVIEDLESAKYQHVEWRVSIYGHSKDEWQKLVEWMAHNKLISRNVRWVIQVPRLYHAYKARGRIETMEEFLENIFQPVIEAVLHPQEHPLMFQMLSQIVAWDSVDDESQVSKFTMEGGDLPGPAEWNRRDNPPYAYFLYYMYANIRTLNTLLQARGMNPMPFRPHCGETGSISHLAAAGLIADGINHGLVLRKSPVLFYLYYLWQIGIAMSPLSNNALFYEIGKSPFKMYHAIGMNVSLSSDDPLMFHFTDEALLEEYSVCAHLWKFSPTDLCEIARRSVLQSNFERQFKRHWLGEKYYKRGAKGNEMKATNVPDARLAYREDMLANELSFIRDIIRNYGGELSNLLSQLSKS